MRRLSERLLTISPAEASFAKRGFARANARVCARLEEVGATFINGYRHSLAEPAPHALEKRLDTTSSELRGFAYEGAAMGLLLQELLFPWQTCFRTFLQGPGQRHVYMMHVGAGWAVARLPLTRNRVIRGLDPVLSSLVLDGEGFHEGYFHPKTRIESQKPRIGVGGFRARVFDQGLGRSLWFVRGADVHEISATIGRFNESRRADLWSGIGLAAGYAGGVDRADLIALRSLAEPYQGHLAQGVAFAAKARQRAGNPASHTNDACIELAGCSADEVATATDDALAAIEGSESEVRYERWREEIRRRLTSRSTGQPFGGRPVLTAANSGQQ